MIEIIIAVVGILIGGGIAFFVVNSKNNGKAKLIIVEAEKNAEQIKKEKISKLFSFLLYFYKLSILKFTKNN